MIAVICLLDFFFFFLQNKARSENAWDLYFSIAPCFFFFFLLLSLQSLCGITWSVKTSGLLALACCRDKAQIL